jgi:hypothetical protein
MTTGEAVEASRSVSSTGANSAAPGVVPRPRSSDGGAGSEPRLASASAIGSSGIAPAPRLADQARFTHAGLAADEHGRRLAARGPLERRAKIRQLRRPADEDRARDAPRHVGSIARLIGERDKDTSLG